VQAYFSSSAGYAVPAAGNASFSGGTKLVLWNDAATPQKLSIGMDSNATMWFCNTGAQSGSNAAGFSWYQGSTAGATPSLTMRLDSSGNLGLGVTPSAANLPTIQSTYGIFTGSSEAHIARNAYYNSGWTYVTSSTATRFSQAGGQHQWYTAPSGTAGNAIAFTQAMTLDASGNLLVGKTAPNTAAGVGVEFRPGGTISAVVSGSTNASGDSYDLYSTGAAAYRFYVGFGGTVYATSTSITAISDISLKENIRPLETGLAEVLALQPRRFDWKNGDGVGVAGFIAQEVIDVLPDLVSDYKYSDEETKKGLKMGDMIPTLVKAIKELSSQVSDLSAELNELKAKVNA